MSSPNAGVHWIGIQGLGFKIVQQHMLPVVAHLVIYSRQRNTLSTDTTVQWF